MDSDLNLFLSYIIAAIQSIFPNACKEIAALLKAGTEMPTHVLSRTLVNELAQIDEDFLPVLDDYYRVHEMAVHDLIAELLRYPPPPLHLVLVSRVNPALPLTTAALDTAIMLRRRK